MANNLFAGDPPKESLEALSVFVKRNHTKYTDFIIPFAGNFGSAQSLVSAGVRPRNIHLSDTCLLSSVVGYYLADLNLSDLNIIVREPELSFLDTQNYFDGTVKHAAATCFAQVYVNTSNKNDYMRAIRTEFIKNSEKYLDALCKQMEKQKLKLKGMSYEVASGFDVIRKWENNDTAFLFIAPPQGKPKTNDLLHWAAPFQTAYNTAQHTELTDRLTNARATAMFYLYHKPTPEGWTTTFAQNFNKLRTDYLACNKSGNIQTIKRRPDVLKKSPYPIFDDFEITKKTKVNCVAISREESAYYRDLFVHRLGSTDGVDGNYLMLLNGKIITVFGMGFRQAFKGLGYVHEGYGISVPSTRYPTINRLFMKLLTCRDFKKQLCSMVNFKMAEWNGLKTACIARMPEVRTNHGLLKLVYKNRDPKKYGGLWKLDYYTDIYDKNYKMCIIEWLDEITKKEKRDAEKEKGKAKGKGQATEGEGTGDGEAAGDGRDGQRDPEPGLDSGCVQPEE